jgi:hypothetical protein
MPLAKSVSASVQGGGIVSNIPELQAWLKVYVQKRNANVYDSVMKKMRDVAYNAWKFTRNAEPSTIKGQLSNLPITKDNKTRNSPSQWVGLYKLINWERKNKGLIALGGSRRRIRGKKKYVVRQTRPQALHMQGKTRGFLAARARSARWLRLGWMAALNSMGVSGTRGQNFGGGEGATLDRITGKAYGGGSQIKKIGPGNTEFMIYNGVGVLDHRYKPVRERSSSDIARARAVQEEGLNKAVDFVIKDMARYIAKNCVAIWNGKEVRVEVE